MSNKSHNTVTEHAFLTLHYRLSTVDGQDIVTTFNENPATLQMGSGQLAPFLETLLIGLPEDTHQIFELTPEQAFGPRNPELIQLVALETLAQHSQEGEEYEIGDLVDFAAPGGGRFAGVMREKREQDALFDFNHPLAGQHLKFEVRIISVM